MSLSTLTKAKLMLATEFESSIQECIDEFSQRLGMSRHEFLETAVIDLMARLSAADQQAPPLRSRLLPQFVYTAKGFMRGAELFEHLREHYAGEERVGTAEGTAARRPPADADSSAGISRTGGDRRAGGDAPGTEELEEGEDSGIESAEDESDRPRIDREIFERIMRYYQDRSAVQGPPDPRPERRTQPPPSPDASP